ncbi:MAG: dockerin type I repeat-containing protein [Porcipelethomonas sp.]
MKKMLNIIAALTAVSISMSTASVAAIAAASIDDNVSDSNTLENSYDINDEDYRRKVDSLGEKIAYEEEFTSYLNEVKKSLINGDIEDCAVTHVYNAANNENVVGVNSRVYIVESIVPDTGKKARQFEKIVYYWGESASDEYSYGFSNADEVFGKYSADEMNVYLEEENLKANIVNASNGNTTKTVVHYDDTSEENVVATFLALNEKFGAELLAYPPEMENIEIFYDVSMLGDANKDGEINVRDAALIAKSLSQGEAASLPKWADYNRDGNINVRDCAAIAQDLADC